MNFKNNIICNFFPIIINNKFLLIEKNLLKTDYFILKINLKFSIVIFKSKDNLYNIINFNIMNKLKNNFFNHYLL